MFQRDPRWLGGDGASSVVLGEGRVVWLFGDSFIGQGQSPRRRDAVMVRNSVGIQTGNDPTTATFKTFAGEVDDRPADFFPPSGSTWYWPGDGEMIDEQLLIFFMAVERSDEGLGFKNVGWHAMVVENPRASPSEWRLRPAVTRENDFQVMLGSGSVLKDEQFLYAFSAREPGAHPVYLVRWPLELAAAGDLSSPEWWTGGESRWLPQDKLAKLPLPLMERGQTEFSVHRVEADGVEAEGHFLQVQMDGFPRGAIAVRRARALWGPWSRLRGVFRPDQVVALDRRSFIYSAKAHPEIKTDGLAVTYCTNSFDLGTLVDDKTLYFPRFIRLQNKPSTSSAK